MNTELSKTISTCTVWLAVACILTFGVFRTSVNGDVAVMLVFFCLPISLVVFAVGATKIIWESRAKDKANADAAPAAVASSPSPMAKV